MFNNNTTEQLREAITQLEIKTKKLEDKINQSQDNNSFEFNEGKAQAKKGGMYLDDYVQIPIKTVMLALLKELNLDIEFTLEKTNINFKKLK